MKKLIGILVLFHAAYSTYEYRQYKAAQLVEEFHIPTDILVEVFVGLVLTLFFGVLQNGKFESIRSAPKGENAETSFARPNFKNYHFSRGKVLLERVKARVGEFKY